MHPVLVTFRNSSSIGRLFCSCFQYVQEWLHWYSIAVDIATIILMWPSVKSSQPFPSVNYRIKKLWFIWKVYHRSAIIVALQTEQRSFSAMAGSTHRSSLPGHEGRANRTSDFKRPCVFSHTRQTNQNPNRSEPAASVSTVCSTGIQQTPLSFFFGPCRWSLQTHLTGQTRS